MVTFLNIILYVLKSVEVLAVTLIVLIGIDLGVYMYNESRPAHRVKTRRLRSLLDKMKAAQIRRRARREQLRIIRQQEAAAHEGFFEGSYVRGFDSNGAMIYRGCQVPTEKARAYYKEIDDLVDASIFDNTKEL